VNTDTKIYHSISEVSQMLGLEAYVLRFWEKEFTQLRPKKNRAGNRVYQQKDIEMLIQIKHLLYDKGFTIEGARNYFKGEGRTNGDKLKADMAVKLLTEIRVNIDELIELFP
jgi:DNA-binding transcriptional MerR regulator